MNYVPTRVAQFSRTSAGPNVSAWLRALASLMFVAGFVERLLPLFDMKNRLFWLHMSEDGYLMQTVARNMALGLGMSTADGTIPTNGVQPLATFAYAGMHALAGGSKQLGIVYVTVFSLAVSVLGAWLCWQLGKAVLRGLPHAEPVAWLAAALWFASPLIVKHTMNGLETGLYYAAIAGVLTYYFSLDLASSQALVGRQRVLLGLLLGVAFLARNDAVFLIAALLVAHATAGGSAVGGGFSRRAVDAVVAGGLSFIVALPWLVHNKLRFGSIVPISGKAESHAAAFGANLSIVPANFFESLMLYAPIPQSLEAAWPVVTAVAVTMFGFGWFAWAVIGRSGVRGQRLCILTLLFGAMLGGYYGLFFGAAWFVSRYLSALTPIFAVMAVYLVWSTLARRLSGQRRLTLGAGSLLGLALAISVGLAARHYQSGVSNGHRQVVEWVRGNVDDRVWVGAVQTGTLGYFHDRTLNLDGKVNPKALRAVVESGQVMTYVLDQTPIEVLADWSGLAGWATTTAEPRFSKAFELVVDDKPGNLAVLRRIKPAIAR